MNSLLERCIIFAVKKHEGQLDKVGLPYILHPLRVMTDPSLTTEEQRCIAVLHDVFEDCVVTYKEINELDLPTNIFRSIEALTHGLHEPNIQYWQRILKDPTGNAKAVKLADIRDNTSDFRMQGLPEKDRVRMLKKYEQALHVLNGGN